jgi:hypothetical protein
MTMQIAGLRARFGGFERQVLAHPSMPGGAANLGKTGGGGSPRDILGIAAKQLRRGDSGPRHGAAALTSNPY